MEEKHKDPYGISGRFFEHDGFVNVWLQTNNPTTQDNSVGQLFIQRRWIYGEPFNACVATMLRALADSVEHQWENLDSPKENTSLE